MEKFLQNTKLLLQNLSKVKLVHVVIGNEACDLDSTVAALSYSYYLCKKKKDQETLYLPILNIRESEYRLRTDTTYFLSKLKIPTNLLTFRNHVNLFKLKEEQKLTLTLVDFNVMTGEDAILDDCITAVFDHHVRERAESEHVFVKLDTVGSCCTLIAEELLADTDFHLDDQVAQLLYGTILVDTINRSVTAGKITPRDEAVLKKLEALLPEIKGDHLFQELQSARFDISGLTNMEIFEKDLKMVAGPSMNIAMSSVTMEMMELLSRPGIKDDLDMFSEKKSADVVVIMTLVTDTSGEPIRHLAVYSQNRIFRDQILDVVISCRDPDLDLQPLETKIDDVTAFRQKNVIASRKKVLPILKTFVLK